MSGQPDPAFLNNVPTALLSIAISLSTSTTSTLTSSSGALITLTASTISTAGQAAASTTSTATPSDGSSIYFYTPSTAVAIVFSVLYAGLIPYHFYLAIYAPHIRKSVAQKHKYTIPLFIACVLSTVGFGLRTASSSPGNRSLVSLYALSQTFIIIAPIFICATLYLLIAYLIDLCLPAGKDRIFLGISPRWLGRAFIISDVLSFMMQGSGSGIASSGGWEGTEKDIGTNILILGLAIQLATFTLYMAIVALFCFRVRAGHEKRENEGHQMPMQSGDGSQVAHTDKRDYGLNPLAKQVVKGIWIACFFIEVRSIFRTIEFGTGVDGYLFRHEWTLWVFDAAPIWSALLVLGFYHPIRWLQSKRRSRFMDKTTRQDILQES